jgi:hypothetical protein
MGASISCRVVPAPQKPCCQKEEEKEQDCCICLTTEGRYITLSCGHRMHAVCVIKWWQHMPFMSLKCPLCSRACTGCFVIIDRCTHNPCAFFRRDDPNCPGQTVLRSTRRTDHHVYLEVTNPKEKEKACAWVKGIAHTTEEFSSQNL